MEFPHLKEIQEQYGERGIQVIGVSMERNLAAARQWPDEFGANFPVLFDPEGEIARKYGVTAIPHNVLIDRDGRIAAVVQGADIPTLEAAVRRVAAG